MRRSDWKSQTLSNHRNFFTPWTAKIFISGWRLMRKLRDDFLITNIFIKSWHPDFFTDVFLFAQFRKYRRRVCSHFSIRRRCFLYFLDLIDNHCAVWSSSVVVGRICLISDIFFIAFSTFDMKSSLRCVCAKSWMVVARCSKILSLILSLHWSKLRDLLMMESCYHWFKLTIGSSSLSLDLSLHRVRPLCIISSSCRQNYWHLLLKIFLWTLLNKAFLKSHVANALISL